MAEELSDENKVNPNQESLSLDSESLQMENPELSNVNAASMAEGTDEISVSLAFTPRLLAPAADDMHYFSNNNSYYPYPGYRMPNCTCYAWGRAYEILGSTPKLGNWAPIQYWNENYAYAKGQTPKLGAIVVWSGHVAVVEKIEGNVVTVSQSSFTRDPAKYAHDMFFLTTYTIGSENSLSKWNGAFQGYIYVGDFSGPSPDTTLNRIGAVSSNGDFYVKEGGLSTAWVKETSNVKQGILSGNRIGVILANGDFLVKEGGLSAAWVNETNNVKQGMLSGDRIGAVSSNGDLFVKEGLSGTWVKETTNVKQGVLSGNRIGALLTNGDFLVKEGGLSASWVLEIGDIKLVALSESDSYIGEDSRPITGITLNKTSLDLLIGNSDSLSVSYTPSDTTEDKTISWSALDSSVATVDGSGRVTAIKAGTTNIVARTLDGKNTATCVVSVTEPLFIPVVQQTLGTKTYLLFDDEITWPEAKSKAEALGGHLVTITSQEEQLLIEKMVQSGQRGAYFMGGTDEGHEGIFTWITGESFGLAKWSSKQPDNSNGNENCLEMYRSGLSTLF